MGRQALAETATFVTDTADARGRFSADARVFMLAWAILTAFAAVAVTLVIGCFVLLSGGKVNADPGTVGIVAGMIGSLVGYLAANAQQVVSYFFGSSKGSKENGEAVRASLTDALKKLSERQVA
jgi:hypothetical protein